MSVLRTTCIPCVPLVEPPVHEFKMSRSVDEITPVFDKNGKQVRTIKSKKVVHDSIPLEVWENRGIDASLFSLENQLASGVNVSEFTGNFIGLDLDVSANLGEKFINSVNNFVASHRKEESDVNND